VTESNEQPRTQVRPPSNQVGPEDEVGLLQLVNVLLRRWRVVLGLPIAVAVGTAVVSLLVPPTYTATAAFVPQASSGAGARVPAGLAGLAGQLGISFGGEASQSPEFYSEVLKSRELLERVLTTRFADPQSARNPPDSAPLYRLLEVDGRDLGDSLYRARRKLEDQIDVLVQRLTGIVRLDVQSRDPVLAASVANTFVGYLNDFNAQTRKSQARERRKFVEAQLPHAEQDLRQAEETLKIFYERNRSWRQSPQLVVEEDRLRRQVQIRQEVYLTLTREFETARIEEVNDTPVITVIDRAVPPKVRSKPRRTLLTAIAFILGGALAIIVAFSADHTERLRRANEGDYREFSGLLAGLRADLGRLVRLRGRRDE